MAARFIVFGKVGSGKSTLCNMLISGHPNPQGGFLASDSVRGVTTAVTTKTSKDEKWIAVDTIGMGETREGTVGTEEAKAKLKDFLRSTRNEYTYIIFVVQKERFVDETSVYWTAFKEIFKGGESNFVVVYTHANQKCIEENREELRKAYDGHSRFIGVDFQSSVEDDRLDDDQRKKAWEKNLIFLKKSLRGYLFNPVRPDICGMDDAALNMRVASILHKLFQKINSIFQRKSEDSIRKMIGNVLAPLLRL